MRKAAIALAILLFAALAALALAPQFVDLDRYRPLVAEKASEWARRPVTLAGPVSLSLLPSPHLVLRDVAIANPPGAQSPDLVRVRQVEAAVSFWPLLSGRVEVQSARLVQPVIALEFLSDGSWSWSRGAPTAIVPATPAVTGAPMPTPPTTTGRVTVANLTIDDATVSYRSGGTLESAEHITLKLSGDVWSGPVHAEGNVTAFGATLTISADLGRRARGPIPLSLRLAMQSQAEMELTGDLISDEAHPRFKGKLAIKGDDLPRVAMLAGIGPLPPMLAQPLRLMGDVEAAGDRVAIDRLSLELGDIHGSGSLAAIPGTPLAIEAKFSMNTFDVDRFLAERATTTDTVQPKSASHEAATTALPRMADLAAAGRFALPPSVTAEIDLGIDAVLWRQSVMRQVHLEAALDGGKLEIRRFGALLPGGSDIVVAGTVDTIAALPRFAGSIEASVDNFRDLLRWAGVAVEGVPAGRLRRATLASQIEIDGPTLEARSIDLSFDAARMTGAATIALRSRLALGARLVVDQLNLDAYLTSDPVEPTGRPPPSALPPMQGAVAVTTRVTVPEVVTRALTSFDANLDVGVDTLIWKGQPIRKVHLIGTLQNRDLTLRELSVNDLGGAQGKLSGYMQGIGATEPKTQVAFDMRGPELSRVLRLLAPSVASADTFGTFSLGGEVERQGERFSLDIDVEAVGGKLHVVGDTPNPDSWDLSVSLEHPSFNRLMRLTGANYRPQGGELGPVKLGGRMEWTPTGATVKDLALDVGGMTVGGEVGLLFEGRPMLKANLTLGELALDKFMPARQTANRELSPRPLMSGVMLAQASAGASRPPGGQRWSATPIELEFIKLLDADVTLTGKGLSWASWHLEDPQVKLALRNAVLGVPSLSGRIFGGALTASGTLNATAKPNLRLFATLIDADFKQAAAVGASHLEGGFNVETTLASEGESPRDLMSALSGTASLRSRGGTINGVNLQAVNQYMSQIKGLGDLSGLLRAATNGATQFSSLDASFKLLDGIARSDDLRLVADGGEGTGAATVDLPDWTLLSRTEIRLTGVQGTPALGVSLKGSLDQPDLRLDIGAIVKAFGERALERLLRPQAQPGQGTGTSPDATPPNSAQPLKPKDILRNLLKGPP